MVWFSIAAFIAFLGIMVFVSDFNSEKQTQENKKAKEEGREAVEIKFDRGELTTLMICATAMAGIFIYWVKNITLIPIIKMYTDNVDMGMLFLAVVLSLLSVDFVLAVAYKLPTAPFLAIAFVLNCALASKAPIVSISIVFILAVCVYGVIKSRNVWITVLESALLKAMMGTSALLTILNVIGIIPSIIILLIIMALTTSVSITVEVFIWKKTGTQTIIVDSEEVKESNLPMIIAHGMVPSRR